MAKPKRPPTRQVQNKHGMYSTVQIPLSEWTAADYAAANAQREGLDDFDAEIRCILAYAYRAAADEANDQGIRENANLLKTMISFELPRRKEPGDTSGAMALVLGIGRLYERICAVANYEPNVQQVRTTTQKLRDGFAAEKGHAPDTILAAVRLYKRLVKAHPGRKKAAVQSEVEQQTGIKPRTLRWHLAKKTG